MFQFGVKSIIKTIENNKFYQDKSYDKRLKIYAKIKKAFQKLGNSNSETATKYLVKTLINKHGKFQQEAAEALVSQRERAILSLLNSIENTDSLYQSYTISQVSNVLNKINPDWRSLEVTNSFNGKIQKMLERFYTIQHPFHDREESDKIGLVKKLSFMKNKDSVDVLFKALSDKSERVQTEAVIALGSNGSERAVNGLLQHIENKNLQKYILDELSKLKVIIPLEQLTDFLHKDDPSIIKSVIQMLVKTNDTRAIKYLKEFLKHKQEDIRGSAVTALGNVGRPEDIESLISVLNDNKYLNRCRAVTAIKKVFCDKSVEKLLKLLTEGQDLQFEAMKALEEILDRHAEKISDRDLTIMAKIKTVTKFEAIHFYDPVTMKENISIIDGKYYRKAEVNCEKLNQLANTELNNR